MIAGSTMLYSFSRTYFNLETGPQFERHADGIVEMLDYFASISSDPNAPPGRHYNWKESPISKQPTLEFTLDHDIALFVSDLAPLPPIKAYLEFQKEENQFWLVWYPDPKFTNNKPEYQYTLLSPWAGDIEYGYYDNEQKSWEFELASSDSRQHGTRRPTRVQLIFEREGQSLRRYIDFHNENRRALTY
ncbi:hypothetical protein [Thalassobacterium sedimentorum]|nr:hypothetical protein [Coraliomargarita sp. SDUM461004]